MVGASTFPTPEQQKTVLLGRSIIGMQFGKCSRLLFAPQSPSCIVKATNSTAFGNYKSSLMSVLPTKLDPAGCRRCRDRWLRWIPTAQHRFDQFPTTGQNVVAITTRVPRVMDSVVCCTARNYIVVSGTCSKQQRSRPSSITQIGVQANRTATCSCSCRYEEFVLGKCTLGLTLS